MDHHDTVELLLAYQTAVGSERESRLLPPPEDLFQLLLQRRLCRVASRMIYAAPLFMERA